MKMTFENEFGIYTVELHQEVTAVDAVIGGMVVPLLRAASYADVSIDRYIETDICTDSFVEANEGAVE